MLIYCLHIQGTKSVRELPPPEELEFRVDSKIHTYIDEAVELQKEAVSFKVNLIKHGPYLSVREVRF